MAVTRRGGTKKELHDNSIDKIMGKYDFKHVGSTYERENNTPITTINQNWRFIHADNFTLLSYGVHISTKLGWGGTNTQTGTSALAGINTETIDLGLQNHSQKTKQMSFRRGEQTREHCTYPSTTHVSRVVNTFKETKYTASTSIIIIIIIISGGAR